MRLFYYLSCLICLCFYSCTTLKPVMGIYRSNFAASASFVEQITLKEDSSFEYQSRGHLLNRWASGRYRIDQDKLILDYVFPYIDTSGTAYLSNLLGFSIEGDRRKWEQSFPRLFFVRNGKLLTSNNNGEVVRKARVKPFLKKPRKKYYLKKIR